MKIGTGIGIAMFNSISEMKRHTETMHKDLLELISTFSDGTISERSCSVFMRW
jgi:uncharacterized protein (DUF4213/DUF364 family)